MTLLSAFVTEYAAEVSALSFLLGLGLGHWLALGRDKRKDFNEKAAPVFDALLKQRELFERGAFEQAVEVPWRHLQPLVAVWDRKRLRSRAERYQQAVDEVLETWRRDDWSGLATHDADRARHVVPAIDRLLALLEPR